MLGLEIALEGLLHLNLGRDPLHNRDPARFCGFFGYAMWQRAIGTGAEQLWRLRKDAHLPPQRQRPVAGDPGLPPQRQRPVAGDPGLECEQRLPDGSYLSSIYLSAANRRRQLNGIRLRVVEYRLDGVEGSEPLYRLATSILDPAQAPAKELAALYHERWEIESAFDEWKTHLRGAQIVLRSKTPELVRQEFYGLLMTHFAIRGLMHQAALRAKEDPDRLSFLHAVRVVPRKIAAWNAIPPCAEDGIS